MPPFDWKVNGAVVGIPVAGSTGSQKFPQGRKFHCSDCQSPGLPAPGSLAANAGGLAEAWAM